MQSDFEAEAENKKLRMCMNCKVKDDVIKSLFKTEGSDKDDHDAGWRKREDSFESKIVNLEEENASLRLELKYLVEEHNENASLAAKEVERLQKLQKSARQSMEKVFMFPTIESEARHRKEDLDGEKQRYGYYITPDSFFKTKEFKPGYAIPRNDSERRKVEFHKHLLRIEAAQESSDFEYGQKLDGRYILWNLVGKGGQAEVWRAWDLDEFHFIALKVYSRASGLGEEMHCERVRQEIAILERIKHGNVVPYHRSFEIDPNSVAAVLGYCSTNLGDVLTQRGHLPENEARQMLVQIMSGMKCLSSKGVIHYDLKPSNILIDDDGNARITDFGLSHWCEPDGCTTLIAGAGTYWYLPPECFDFDRSVSISNKVDVWSIGVIFYQMLFGELPFGNGQTQKQIRENRVIRNATEISRFPPAPQGATISKQAKDFISTALNLNHSKRPFVKDLCSHAYLRDASIC